MEGGIILEVIKEVGCLKNLLSQHNHNSKQILGVSVHLT